MINLNRFKIKYTFKKKGFSLLEMIVSLGIISIMLVLLSNVMITSLRISAKTAARGNAREEVSDLLSSIRKDIRNGDFVQNCSGSLKAGQTPTCTIYVSAPVNWGVCNNALTQAVNVCKRDSNGNIIEKSEDNLKIEELSFEEGFSETESSKVILVTLIVSHTNPGLGITNLVQQTSITTRNYGSDAQTRLSTLPTVPTPVPTVPVTYLPTWTPTPRPPTPTPTLTPTLPPPLISDPFNSVSWSSIYDISQSYCGLQANSNPTAASYTIEGGTGIGGSNALRITRPTISQSTSVRTITYGGLPANRTVLVSIWAKVPQSFCYYDMRIYYTTGRLSAQSAEHGVEPSTCNNVQWTTWVTFNGCFTSTNGNGDTWTKYQTYVSMGSNTELTLAFRAQLGQGGVFPITRFDDLRIDLAW